MDQPIITQKMPYVQTLTPGKYAWCSCGKSQKNPFCDGSHKVTNLKPVVFEITEEKKVALCGCKHTNSKPFCDGTHRNL